MATKKTPKILSSDVESEIREIVRDEMKKSTKTDMKNLLNEIEKIIAETVKSHLLSISTFITSKISKKGD